MLPGGAHTFIPSSGRQRQVCDFKASLIYIVWDQPGLYSETLLLKMVQHVIFLPGVYGNVTWFSIRGRNWSDCLFLSQGYYYFFHVFGIFAYCVRSLGLGLLLKRADLCGRTTWVLTIFSGMPLLVSSRDPIQSGLKRIMSLLWWHMPVIELLGRQRKANLCELQASLVYTVRHCFRKQMSNYLWAMWGLWVGTPTQHFCGFRHAMHATCQCF